MREKHFFRSRSFIDKTATWQKTKPRSILRNTTASHSRIGVGVNRGILEENFDLTGAAPFNFVRLCYNNGDMLNIVGNDITRGGEKIGYFQDNDIYNHEGKKLGYFTENDIYNVDGRKLAYIEGNFIKTFDDKTMRLEDNREHVSGGTLSDLARVAIRMLLGD